MMTAMRFFASAAVMIITLGGATAVAAADSPAPGRVDLIDMSRIAETVLSATIEKTRTIPDDKAPGIAPGYRRLLVEANINSLLTAKGPIPAQIEYLVDVPETRRGRAPKIEGERVLLFLGREHGPGEFALAHKYGQQAWTSARETELRGFISELTDPKLQALRPTKIVSAFHVPGSLPGESESQVFMQTASGRPMSLVVLNRPGETPRYSVATGDIIDPNASAPVAGSVVALTLACDLPETLPEEVFKSQAPASREGLVADFAFVRQQLGECERNF